MKKTALIWLWTGLFTGTLLISNAAGAYAGGFAQTCVNVYVQNIYEKTELYASCKSKAGAYKDTSINLDLWIGNDHGNLVWCDGGINYNNYFSRTCGWMSLSNDNKTLYAKCQKYVDGKRLLNDTSIDLNAKITNKDGVLVRDSRY